MARLVKQSGHFHFMDKYNAQKEFLKKAGSKIKRTKSISEKDIEDAFCDYAKTMGCKALKLVLLGLRGFPDRTILCPGGRVLFIEFKAPGKKLSPTQKPWKRLLESFGFQYHICDQMGQAEDVLKKFLLSEM